MCWFRWPHVPITAWQFRRDPFQRSHHCCCSWSGISKNAALHLNLFQKEELNQLEIFLSNDQFVLQNEDLKKIRNLFLNEDLNRFRIFLQNEDLNQFGIFLMNKNLTQSLFPMQIRVRMTSQIFFQARIVKKCKIRTGNVMLRIRILRFRFGLEYTCAKFHAEWTWAKRIKA